MQLSVDRFPAVYDVSGLVTEKKLAVFSTVYWCVATAIYLGWSFWTQRWDFTWLVWPVAGVLYGAVSAIAGAMIKKQ